MNDLVAPVAPLTLETVAGFDVGVTGGCSLIRVADRALLDCVDMPVLEDGPAGRRTINGALLADILRRWSPSHAVVEAVGARPGEAASFAFSFGRSYGCVLGVLSACGVPWSTMAPPKWRRIIGFPPGTNKDLSRSEALRRFPDRAALFARKKDDGRAEAVLVALAYLIQEGGRV